MPTYDPSTDKRPLRLLTKEERKARAEWKREERERQYIQAVLTGPGSRSRNPETRRRDNAIHLEYAEELIKKHAAAALRRQAVEGIRMDLDAIAAVRFLVARVEELERRVATLEMQLSPPLGPHGPTPSEGELPFLVEVPPEPYLKRRPFSEFLAKEEAERPRKTVAPKSYFQRKRWKRSG